MSVRMSKHRFLARRVGMLLVGTIVVVAVVLLLSVQFGAPESRGADAPRVVPAVAQYPATGDRPQEDDAAFNSCTMGVNGLYPVSDPRYRVPACDGNAVLPFGRFFRVEISPNPGNPAGLACTAGHEWWPAEVRVMVMEPNGYTEVIRVEADECVWTGDVYGSASWRLGKLYLAAARTLDV